MTASDERAAAREDDYLARYATQDEHDAMARALVALLTSAD